MFIKYISDKYAGLSARRSPIRIPEGASFADMVALKGSKDIGDKINTKIIEPFAEANQMLSQSDFPDFNDEKLGDGDEKSERLTNLVSIFEPFGTPPGKQGDYAYLLHIVRSLKSTGTGACILPHGVLFRGNAEAAILRKLVHSGYIKGIIGLPANLFYGTGIPACIIVVDKRDAKARKGVFMIDALQQFWDVCPTLRKSLFKSHTPLAPLRGEGDGGERRS